MRKNVFIKKANRSVIGMEVGKMLARCSIKAAFSALAILLAANSYAADDQAEYSQRFITQYNKIKDPANGYFSSDGVPYHSVETMIVEAPDYGHETTSEAYSYWLWLEAQYGRATGDWAPLNKAWANMEKYIIPAQTDQPSNASYNDSKPATYAPEYPQPSSYPSPMNSAATPGKDPLFAELSGTYGTKDIYGMHWLLDVDNWYGYGHCGDGVTKPAYINTFQRGEQESVWETVPHPSCETFKWGRTGNTQGFLSLFMQDSNYSKQWRYTNAPDADARAIQAVYWASVWAKAQGKSADIADIVKKASKMGDYLRYSMFDKYFKKIGNCVGATTCQPGTGQADASGYRDNQHYLMSWYYAWGGALDNGGWAWRIGDSHNHFGYQNPLTAWVLSSVSDFKPATPTGAGDWGKSLKRMMEFYTWLQSSEGAIAGGATNSYGGSYAQPPAGTPTFYGMPYVVAPVYNDPPSNQWFGMQAWSMERVAEYYYSTGDTQAKALLDKWVTWVIANVKLNTDGTYAIPSTLAWSGAPDTWNPTSPGKNASLHVSIVDYTTDVGPTAGLARTLTFYAAKSKSAAAKTLAKELLDRMWTKYQDSLGVAVPETRADYTRFTDKYNATTGQGIYIPSGWTGTNAQGATIDQNVTFASMRPKYQNDKDWAKLNAFIQNPSSATTWTYHRFWAQSDIAMAMADYGRLLTNTSPSIVVSSSGVDVNEGSSSTFTVALSDAPTANTVVSIAKVSGEDSVSASATSLTFTPTNYNVPQTVTVAAAIDSDQVDGTATFTLSATSFTTASVIVTEHDKDKVVPVPSDCNVTVDTSSDWGVGQVLQVTMQNTGTSPINAWSLSWTESNDFTVVNSWNGTIKQSGRIMTVTPSSSNGSIPAAGNVGFGMQLTYSGAKPVPSNVSLASHNCQITVK